MGDKRIYLGRKSKYATMIGVPVIITITSLFLVLSTMGFDITGTDDYNCGTLERPCVSYGKICNPFPYNVDIYNPDELKINFYPNVENHWIFFKDGRYKKEFLMPQGVEFSTKGWRYENFTNETKPRKDRVYVHRFPSYKCQEYMLVGLKDPTVVVKWEMSAGNGYLDPVWGVNESDHIKILGSDYHLRIKDSDYHIIIKD